MHPLSTKQFSNDSTDMILYWNFLYWLSFNLCLEKFLDILFQSQLENLACNIDACLYSLYNLILFLCLGINVPWGSFSSCLQTNRYSLLAISCLHQLLSSAIWRLKWMCFLMWMCFLTYIYHLISCISGIVKKCHICFFGHERHRTCKSGYKYKTNWGVIFEKCISLYILSHYHIYLVNSLTTTHHSVVLFDDSNLTLMVSQADSTSLPAAVPSSL